MRCCGTTRSSGTSGISSEGVGPELRQYIVVDNNAEKPFSRDQRRWIYTAAKQRDTSFGFGTDKDLETALGYLIVKQSPFPASAPHVGDPGFDADSRLPAAKVFGRARGRARAFRARSVVNLSSMSYGSLGARRSSRSTGAPRWPGASRGRERVGSAPSTSMVATWSGRLARDTSGVGTRRDASTSPGSGTWSPPIPRSV